MINSRKKGSKNERDVAKLFREWSGYEFARTPQSGGLHWKKQHTSGDIVCIDERHGSRYPFSLECKAHNELDLLYLIDNKLGKKTRKIILFWEQTLKDAVPHNKVPLLFMRRSGMKSNTHFVVMPTNFFLLWTHDTGFNIFTHGIIHFSNIDHSFTIINSENLFSTDYKAFYQLGKKVYRKMKKHGS